MQFDSNTPTKFFLCNWLCASINQSKLVIEIQAVMNFSYSYVIYWNIVFCIIDISN